MKTALTELLGIDIPLIQGAMAWISDARLVAAVANAGATGVIAAGGLTAGELSSQIRKAKTLTDKPFGVNVMLMAPNKEEIVEVICAEHVAFVTLGGGDPVPYIKRLQASGSKVIPVVPNVKLAQRMEVEGADAIIVEGMEAGGHIGKITTIALMTQVIPHVNLPVVVAGGIVDGRGMAAALTMGAVGVQMGTRFMVAEECSVHPKAKEMLIAAKDTDSVVTGWTCKYTARSLKNALTTKLQQLEIEGGKATEQEIKRLILGAGKKGMIDGDTEWGMIMCGQSLYPITKIESAKTIINNIVDEVKQAINKATALIL